MMQTLDNDNSTIMLDKSYNWFNGKINQSIDHKKSQFDVTLNNPNNQFIQQNMLLSNNSLQSDIRKVNNANTISQMQSYHETANFETLNAGAHRNAF